MSDPRGILDDENERRLAMCDEDAQFEFERDRQTVSALLVARDQHHAAAIVAVSVFESSYVGCFTDEPGYSATLHVPPELFDRARTEFHEPITAACAAVVVGEPFLGVTFRVRRPPYDTDWIATIINTLQPRWVASERLPSTEVTQ
jgi:hypothetical protein